VGFAAGAALAACVTPYAFAYIEAPHSLGQVINLSTNVLVLRVEKVDREKNLIVFRKARDIKGTHPGDVVRHNIGRQGYNPREWQWVMEWAEPGKTAVMFHNGGAAEVCTGNYWYQLGAGGDWWTMTHGEPGLLRTFYGNADKLAAACAEIVAGREAVVPSMVDGNRDDLHLRRAKVQRLRASLKLGDYNVKRDFVGLGGEDFRRLAGMPGFTHLATLTRVDPDAQSVSCVDIDGDGKPDVCLAGGGRAVLLQNGGDSLNEVALPAAAAGCRAAVWADYNGDGRPDLLLATAEGPRLFTNLGGSFRDDSHLLPSEPGYNLTAAAWIDYDGDGRPDILLGNGHYGLRLYRNKGPVDPAAAPVRLGKWWSIGPFPNPNGQGFGQAYPPEQGVNLTAKHGGKNGEEAAWKEGPFRDGEVNSLALFRPENNVDVAVYLHREIECAKPTDLPVSLGSSDGLVAWLNGEKVASENVSRPCLPDQTRAVLKLKAGKNALLLKVCNGLGPAAFFFRADGATPAARTWAFEDVSTAVGLGPRGVGSAMKGDTLTVCDVNGDGRPDFLYGAGTGLLVLNTPGGFVEAKDSGIVYKTGRVGPVFGDFDGDGFPDLFVPQDGGCKLFRNDGRGHFTDVTAKAGLAGFAGTATCAAWGDLDSDGHLDLVVGCLRGPNRFFRNRGDGTFEDATEAIGLGQRVFNTQAVCLADLNNDGVLDVVFNNESQDPVVLLGNPEFGARRTPVLLRVAGKAGVLGSQVRVLDKGGALRGTHWVSGGDGRGSQATPVARFALPPGTYRVEVRYSTGERRAKEIAVAATVFRGVLDEQTPKAE
jgi:hypothetical protein